MPTDFDTWRRDFQRQYEPLKPSPPDPQRTLYRFMELDYTRAQGDQRTVEAILSTENPVARGGYREILKHDAKNVNLERASDGGLPLLWSHNQEKLIGRAENIRVLDGALRARLRFSKSAEASKVWDDIEAGIVRGISIGYQIQEFTEQEGDDSRGKGWGSRRDIVATRWMPYEASIVAVPADIGAKVGRALDAGMLRDLPADVQRMDLQQTLLREYDTSLWVMDGNTEPFTRQIEEVQRNLMEAKTETDANRCRDLLRDLGNAFENHDPGSQISGIRSGDPAGGNAGWHRPNFLSKSTPTMNQQFSLCRALAMTFDPQAARAGGPEMEIMQAAAAVRGNRSGEGYTLPHDMVFRALNKATEGTDLVGVSHRPDLYIEALRARMITGRMGATILPGLTSDIQIPRKTADSTASWIAGDGADQVSPSDPTFGRILMSPTTVGTSCTISRKMLIQGDPASEQLVRDTLAYAVARAIDVAAVSGDGNSNVPTGILNTASIGTDTYANAGKPNFADIVDMEGALMIDDADMGNLGYVTTGLLAAYLKQTPVVSGQDRMIWTSNQPGEGILNGYRAAVSNLVPAGYILFGNWSDLLIGLWSGLDFVVDPYSRASYGDVVITLMQDCDVAVRHGESFAEIHEAAP